MKNSGLKSSMKYKTSKSDMLQTARKSRAAWVLSVRDKIRIMSNETVAKELDYETELPANETLQKLMNFLTDIVDDGERFDVGTLNISDVEDLSGTNPSEDLDADIITIRNPMSPFDLFLNKLLQLQAVEYVKSLQHFVSKVTASVWRSRKDVAALSKLKAATSGHSSTDHLATLTMSTSIASRLSGAEELNLGELASIVWSYLDELLLQMKQSPLWLEESAQQFEQTSKHCERFLFKQLHSSLSAASSVAGDDQRTHDRISSLQFLSAEHLDIRSFQYLLEDSADPPGSSADPGAGGAPGREATVLAEAVQHLRELENARCPEDKLLCVRNCSVAIAQLLKTAHQRKSELQAALRPATSTSTVTSASTPGADELLPVMILTIKCCNPRDIHSDIKYLQHFLRPARMVSEAGYLLTNLVSAVYFLDNVDAQALTIEPAEFDRAILRCKQQAKEANMRMLARTSKRNSNSSSSGLLLSYDRFLPSRAREVEDTEAAARSAGEEADRLIAQYQRDKIASGKALLLTSSVFQVYKGL